MRNPPGITPQQATGYQRITCFVIPCLTRNPEKLDSHFRGNDRNEASFRELDPKRLNLPVSKMHALTNLQALQTTATLQRVNYCDFSVDPANCFFLLQTI